MSNNSNNENEDFVNYSELETPNKPKPEWGVEHRRAYILRLVEDKGHPKMLNQSKIASEFDLSRQQIHYDIKHIRDYFHSQADDSFKSDVIITMDKSVRELMDKGEFVEASKAAKRYAKVLESLGIVSSAPDEHINHEGFDLSEASISIDVNEVDEDDVNEEGG